MKLVTTAAAAALCVGASVALSGPAWADDPLGAYTLLSDQSQRTVNGVLTPYQNSTATWVLGPCNAGCLNIQSSAGWSAYAYLNNGRWEFTREASWVCPDGRTLPSSVGYSFDAATLTGTSWGNVPVSCEGIPLTVDGVTVSLSKV